MLNKFGRWQSTVIGQTGLGDSSGQLLACVGPVQKTSVASKSSNKEL